MKRISASTPETAARSIPQHAAKPEPTEYRQGGLALGRLLASRTEDRFALLVFDTGCIPLASGALITAVLAPALPLSIALFGVAGVFFGPIHPMILAVGGDLYPHRLPVLSGALGAAGVLGTMVYRRLWGSPRQGWAWSARP